MADNEHDVDGLLRKNAELLAEVKTLKAKIADTEGERDSAKQAAGEAQDAMRRVAVEKPLEQALGGAFVAPWRVVRPLLDEHFAIGLGADDVPDIKTIVTEGDGEAVGLTELMAQVQTIPDLAAMLRPPSGGGARGGDGRDGPATVKTEPKEKVASTFGLR